MGVMDEIKELQKKAGSYDTLKEEYDRIKTIVKDLRDTCNTILKENDYSFKPLRSVGKRQECQDKIFNMMKDEDFHATSKSVMLKFPELNVSTINNIMQNLKKLPEVESTKDGVALRLFYRKRINFDPVNHMG